MKILGALLIVIAGGAMGAYRSEKLKKRAELLRSMTGALVIMRQEICTYLTPMRELAEKLAERSDDGTGVFFSKLSEGLNGLGDRQLGEIWTEAVSNTAELCLTAEETAELCRLGWELGRFAAEQQEQAITACIGRMESFAFEAEKVCAEKGRLCMGLGFISGAMLAVVLI